MTPWKKVRYTKVRNLGPENTGIQIIEVKKPTYKIGSVSFKIESREVPTDTYLKSKKLKRKLDQIYNAVNDLLIHEEISGLFFYRAAKKHRVTRSLFKKDSFTLKTSKKSTQKKVPKVVASIAIRLKNKLSNLAWKEGQQISGDLISIYRQKKFIRSYADVPTFKKIKNGYFRPVKDIITRYCNKITKSKYKTLHWFNERDLLIWVITIDGFPTSSNTVSAQISLWNIGKELRSRKNWRTIFVFDGTEKHAYLQEPCRFIDKTIEELEQNPITYEHFKFKHFFVGTWDMKQSSICKGQTGQSSRNPIPYCRISSLYDFVTKLILPSYEDRLKAYDGFQASNQTDDELQLNFFGQKNLPLFKTLVDRDCPEPLHSDINGVSQWLRLVCVEAIIRSNFDKNVNEKLCNILNQLKLDDISKIVATTKSKEALVKMDFRLMGKQAIHVMRHFSSIGNALKINTPKNDDRRNHLTLIGLLLGLMSQIYSRLFPSRRELSLLKKYCEVYFKIHKFYFSKDKITPTVFSIGNLIPLFADRIHAKFGVGLGFFSTQPCESKYQWLKEKEKQTNHDDKKWKNVMEDEYLIFEYLPELGVPFSTPQEKWTPRAVQFDEYTCVCGFSTRRIMGIQSDLSVEENEDQEIQDWLEAPYLCEDCRPLRVLFVELMEQKQILQRI
jgi:hypothetical protein